MGRVQSESVCEDRAEKAEAGVWRRLHNEERHNL